MSAYPYRLPAQQPVLTISHEPENSLWIIELHNGDENRLTEQMIETAIKPALNIVERDWRATWRAATKAKDKEGGKGALIIVGKRDQDKFFSNGLDFQRAIANPNFFPVIFDPMLARLLSFPIPVIAAFNGHAFAGGFMLGLACDYRVMSDGKQKRSWCSMNEIHFGAPLPHSFCGVLNTKVATPQLLRKVALEGHRFTPDEALAAGLIDAVAKGSSTNDVLDAAKEIAKRTAGFARGGSYGLMKKGLYKDALDACAADFRQVFPPHEDAAFRARL